MTEREAAEMAAAGLAPVDLAAPDHAARRPAAGRAAGRRAALPASGRRARHRAPAGLVPLAALAVAFLALPLVAVAVRTPWGALAEELAAPGVLAALRLSLVCSLGALALSFFLGLPLAWVLARVPFRGRRIVRALVILPMVLPPVVGGVALLLAYGRQGIVGHLLEQALGITLPFTTAGVIVAEAFVGMPFFVVTVEAGLRAMDGRYEEAAASLGAGRWTTFRRVTLPLLAPSLGAGAALCWARALGEFGATITFAGNLPGSTQTMPLAVYLALQTDTTTAVALSAVMLAISLTVLVVLRDRWFRLP
ncbi:MAG TPA: ABC transporter permease [Thermoleophilia bacterium]|nr:ABC transporter permease [Thermoleophilia bacterium]